MSPISDKSDVIYSDREQYMNTNNSTKNVFSTAFIVSVVTASINSIANKFIATTSVHIIVIVNTITPMR